jgi:hypothetical protein
VPKITTSTPWVGNHVSLMRFDDSNPTFTPLGKVMGFGTSNGQPVAIVELDEPAWTEGRKHFINVIVAHLDSLAVTSAP